MSQYWRKSKSKTVKSNSENENTCSKAAGNPLKNTIRIDKNFVFSIRKLMEKMVIEPRNVGAHDELRTDVAPGPSNPDTLDTTVAPVTLKRYFREKILAIA